MTSLEALVGLNMCLDIGGVRLGKLLAYFGRPENIFKARREELMTVFGIGEKIAAGILSVRKERIDKEFKLSEKLGLKIISRESTDYPRNLTYISDPPIVLYVKGEIQEEDALAIGVVGSRRASFYGLSSAEKFAVDLCGRGYTVVSGLARGIDTAAHTGALKSGGRTIAVIGSGFNRLYPKENMALADSITRQGAVVSEFPIDAAPLKQNFPRRNRVISGLSLGVVVVEAARNSGALITANFALEQGREVFALPGKIDSAGSFGTHELIKQGAKLVTSVADIEEELQIGILPKSKAVPVPETGNANAVFPELTPQEASVFFLFHDRAIHLDELAENSGVEISKIYSILLRLQQRNLIKELPGKQFMRVHHG
ncbi:MAG: DNA-processing protein DprA [Candidatus Omnitrophica bacterium]|nr:DNA-processing protein DprA [Candidatus Omnitrophota bacterium]